MRSLILTTIVTALSISLFTLGCSNSATANQDAEVPAVLFLGKSEIAFQEQDGKERWRFKSDGDGDFFRATGNHSRVQADDELLLVSTTTSLIALDITNGHKHWSYKLPKPSRIAACISITMTDNQVIVAMDQIGAPLVCLDKKDGSVQWQYPPDSSSIQIGFGQLLVDEGNVLFHATISRDGRSGYDTENQAVDLASGESVEWSDDFADPQQSTPAPAMRAVFGGEADVPIAENDSFIGILESTSGTYELQRPDFFTDRPRFQFHDFDAGQFREMTGKRVKIRGEIATIQESMPPIINVKVTSIKSLED